MCGFRAGCFAPSTYKLLALVPNLKKYRKQGRREVSRVRGRKVWGFYLKDSEGVHKVHFGAERCLHRCVHLEIISQAIYFWSVHSFCLRVYFN